MSLPPKFDEVFFFFFSLFNSVQESVTIWRKGKSGFGQDAMAGPGKETVSGRQATSGRPRGKAWAGRGN